MTVRPITPAVGRAREAHRRAQVQSLPCDADCLVCQRTREAAAARAAPAPPARGSGASTASTLNTPPWSYHP